MNYKLEGTSEYKILDHNFFISEITNFPEREIIDYEKDMFCKKEGFPAIMVIKNAANDKFYMKYYEGNDLRKH